MPSGRRCALGARESTNGPPIRSTGVLDAASRGLRKDARSFFSRSKVSCRRLVCYTARGVIAVARQKGGVGKNMAIDLAAAPMLGDHATVVFDPRGTATTGHRA